MWNCHRLWEYAFFVDQIDEGTRCGLAMRTSVNNAIDYCIQNNILKDILEESRMEVVGMLLNEFNEHRYKKFIREEAMEEGIAQGIEQGQNRVNLLYQKLREDGRVEDVMKAIDNSDYLEQLLKEYEL